MRIKRRGFTLIELLVAVAVGIILLGGLIQIFVMTKNNYRIQQGLNYMQENLRFGLGEVGYSARMAGYFWTIGQPTAVLAPNVAAVFGSRAGSSTVRSPGELTVLPGSPALPCGLLSWVVGVQGFNAVAAGAGPPCVDAANYLRGTDAMLVTYLRPAFIGLPAIVTPAAAAGSANDLTQPASPPIVNTEMYSIVFDPESKGDVNATQGGLIGTGALLGPYVANSLFYSADENDLIRTNGLPPENIIKRGAAMMPLQVEIYYIRPCAVLNNAGLCDANSDAGNAQPTLVRRALGANGNFLDEAIVSGVEQFQVEYLASGCGGYLNADQINTDVCLNGFTPEQKWARVINSRITMLARSNERGQEVDATLYNLSADTPAYLPGSAAQLPANNRYRRRIQVSIAQIRNGVRPLPPPRP